jgi:hypothetical protein
MKVLGIVGASLVLGAGVVSALTITTTVNGTSGPWLWANGGLNTAYQYGLNTIGAPTVVSAADGFRFSVGDSLTISYLSGQVKCISPSGSFWDANGDQTFVMNNGNFGWVGPSYYMNPATYPIYAGELVGTFANDSGQIVGTPFAIGNLGTFTVPNGATRLQLGINDTLLADNSGSFSIHVTGIPEPTTIALVLLSVVGMGLVARRRT